MEDPTRAAVPINRMFRRRDGAEARPLPDIDLPDNVSAVNYTSS